MKPSARARGPSALLLLLCLALGAGLYAVMYMDRDAQTGRPLRGGGTETQEASRAGNAGSDVSRTSMPRRAAFAAFVERPLFHPSRRPAPEAEVVQTRREVQEPSFSLVGVVIDKGTRIALLRPRASTRILRAVEGQEIEGWRIDEIGSESVFVRQGEASAEIVFEDSPFATPAQRGRPADPEPEAEDPEEEEE